MTLEDVSNLSQAIAAVAVVVSLIYLALQTRQSVQNQQAMMHSARLQDIRNDCDRIGDPSFAATWRTGLVAADDISPDEIQQFTLFGFRQLLGIQETFLNWRAGLVDEERWRATRIGLEGAFAAPGYRAVYRLWRETANAGFRAVADTLLAEAKGKPFPDLSTAWLALAAEERAAPNQPFAP